MVIIPKGITDTIQDYANQEGINYDCAIMEVIGSGIKIKIEDAL